MILVQCGNLNNIWLGMSTVATKFIFTCLYMDSYMLLWQQENMLPF